jgi:hypothetical protein
VEKRITYSENGDPQLDSENQEGATANLAATQEGSRLADSHGQLMSEEQGDIGNLELALGTEIRLPDAVLELSKLGIHPPKELTSPVDVRPEPDSASKKFLQSSLEEMRQEISRLRTENSRLKQEIGSERTLMTQQIKQLDDERRKLELLRTDANAQMECAKTEWGAIKSAQQELEHKLTSLAQRDESLQTETARLQAEMKAFEERKEAELKTSDVKIEFNIKSGTDIIGGAKIVDSGAEIGTEQPKPTNIQTSDPFDTAFGGEEGFRFDFVSGCSPQTNFGETFNNKQNFLNSDEGLSDGIFDQAADTKKKLIFESMIEMPAEPPKIGDYHSVSPYDFAARNELDIALKKDSPEIRPSNGQIVQADSFILDEDGNDPSKPNDKILEEENNQGGVSNTEFAKLKAKLEQAEKARNRREDECSTLNARIVTLEADIKKISHTVTTLSCHNSSLQNLVYQLGREKTALREKLIAQKALTANICTTNEDSHKQLSESSHPRAAETIKSAATGENQTGRQVGFLDETDFPPEEDQKHAA